MLLHASCVAYGPAGVLISGRSSSGKSSLALTFLALGAELISDDQTVIELQDGSPIAKAPKALRGLIEARGIGLLHAQTRPLARIDLVIDLDQTETARLPPDRTTRLLDHPVALLHKVESPHFAVGILQYLKGGKAIR